MKSCLNIYRYLFYFLKGTVDTIHIIIIRSYITIKIKILMIDFHYRYLKENFHLKARFYLNSRMEGLCSYLYGLQQAFFIERDPRSIRDT